MLFSRLWDTHSHFGQMQMRTRQNTDTSLGKGRLFPVCVCVCLYMCGWRRGGVFCVAFRILMSQVPQSQAKRALINCSILWLWLAEICIRNPYWYVCWILSKPRENYFAFFVAHILLVFVNSYKKKNGI